MRREAGWGGDFFSEHLLKLRSASPEKSNIWSQILTWCSLLLLLFLLWDMTLCSMYPCATCGLMTKQDQPDKSIPAYMNGNDVPWRRDWLHWCSVGIRECFYFHCARPIENTFQIRCLLRKYIMCGVRKVEGHTCSNNPTDAQPQFSVSGNWTRYDEVKLNCHFPNNDLISKPNLSGLNFSFHVKWKNVF